MDIIQQICGDSRSFGPLPMENIVGRVIYASRSPADHGSVKNRFNLPKLFVIVHGKNSKYLCFLYFPKVALNFRYGKVAVNFHYSPDARSESNREQLYALFKRSYCGFIPFSRQYAVLLSFRVDQRCLVTKGSEVFEEINGGLHEFQCHGVFC